MSVHSGPHGAGGTRQPDDTAGQPFPARPEIPKPNTYLVRRLHPDTCELEEITVVAHESATNPEGNVLRFTRYAIDADGLAHQYIARSFNGWVDYEEVFEIVDPPKLIVGPNDNPSDDLNTPLLVM